MWLTVKKCISFSHFKNDVLVACRVKHLNHKEAYDFSARQGSRMSWGETHRLPSFMLMSSQRWTPSRATLKGDDRDVRASD